MAAETYWLYDWIDAHGIKTASQADKLLHSARPRLDLRGRAEHRLTINEPLGSIDGPTIVAGRPIDISGQLDCIHWLCIKKQIDTLFGHVLHYFDRIVVAGPSYSQIANYLELGDEQSTDVILGFIRILLYVREIGGADFLVFREKPALCEHHVHEALKSAGLGPVWSDVLEHIDALAKEAKVATKKIGPYTSVRYEHPMLPEPKFTLIRGRKRVPSERTLRKRVTADLFLGTLAALGSDIVASQKLEAPLGTTMRFRNDIVDVALGEPTASDVAFQMDLPVLSGISPANLIKLRRDEHLSFERFRDALRVAIQERIRIAGDPDAAKIAKEIRSDVIEPALRNIEQRLRAAKTALGDKINTALIVAALPTICGIYTSTLLLAAAGLPLATGSVLTATQKYFDQKAALKSENMYFLWRAQGHAGKKLNALDPAR